MKKRFKYREVAVLDVSVGGDTPAREIVQYLRRHSFVARRGYSPYVGKCAIVVDFNTRRELRQILASLKYGGYLSFVNDQYSAIISNLERRADYAGYVSR